MILHTVTVEEFEKMSTQHLICWSGWHLNEQIINQATSILQGFGIDMTHVQYNVLEHDVYNKVLNLSGENAFDENRSVLVVTGIEHEGVITKDELHKVMGRYLDDVVSYYRKIGSK